MNPTYVFKQAVTFGKGLTYSKGIHRVPENVTKFPYFLDLQKAGLVVSTENGAVGPAVPPVSQLEIQKKAVQAVKAQGEKTAKDAAAAKAAAPASEATPAVSVAVKKGKS